jgi:hypothetical protein
MRGAAERWEWMGASSEADGEASENSFIATTASAKFPPEARAVSSVGLSLQVVS